MANRAAPLMNSKGQVTQAVFIFTNMLRKLLQDEKPKYIAAIFESKEKTFRHEAFADYKANRAANARRSGFATALHQASVRSLQHADDQRFRLRSRRRDRHAGSEGRRKRAASGHRFERQGHVPARARSLDCLRCGRTRKS